MRKIYGLPRQFLVVVVVSAALTIFFGAWAADARVEARVEAYEEPSGQPDATGIQFPGEVEKEWWESTVLLVCPLH